MPAIVRATLTVAQRPRISLDRVSRAYTNADLAVYAANPLTAAELQQLQNIGSSVISAAQWGYVAATTAFGAGLMAAANLAGAITALGGAAAVVAAIGAQPLDAQLTDVAGLTPTANTAIAGNGSNFVSLSTSAISVTSSGSANTHTLADWLNGWGTTADTVTVVGFHPDVTPTTRVHRCRDRLFVGEAADVTGNLVGSQGSIIPTSTEGANWALRGSQFLVICDANSAGMAITGVSRSSDNAGATLAVSGFIINDRTGASAWALYADIQHESGMGAWSAGLEVAAKNKSTNLTISPYSWAVGGVYGLWLAAGGDSSYGGAPTNPSNAAIGIMGNSSTWNVGIAFESGGLTSVSGLFNAMVMGANHVIRWDRADDTPAARIYSAITTAGLLNSIVFSNTGIQLRGTDSESILTVAEASGTGVNGVNIQGAATGAFPIIEALGTDTNLNLFLRGQADGFAVGERVDTSTAAVVTAFRVRHTITGTPAIGCGVAIDFQVETADSHYEVGAIVEAVTTNVTDTTEAFDLTFKLMAAGAAAAEKLRLTSAGGLIPGANDGTSLGILNTAFSDLFLAAGAVINFNAGDVTITAGTNALTFAGATNGYTFNNPIKGLDQVVAHIGTAIPAGGTAGAGFVFSSTANFGMFFGSGAPSLSAAKGSLYLRSDGSTTNDRAYINTNGSTTWTALTTAA